MAVAVAMVLAAGFGTRLAPLTDELPKPLVPIGDRSVLAHVVGALRAAGLGRIVVNAHHHPGAVMAEAERLALSATSIEATILGTAGGVAHARAKLGEGPILVHNGDILAELDLERLLAEYRRDEPFALLAVKGGLAPGYGNVGLDGRRIVRLRSHAFAPEREGALFAGVQVIGPGCRAALVPRGCLVGDVYVPALDRGERIEAAALVRHFDDVGTPADYLAANLRWLGDRNHHAPGVTIPAGVTLRRSIVADEATVSGAGLLERCVVWPGARAVAPLADAIVTHRAVVQLTAARETTSPRC